MSEVKISPVSHHEIRSVMPHVLHLLKKIYRRTPMEDICPPEEITSCLEARTMQLWVSYLPTGEITGMAITRIDEYRKGKACTIIGCGMEESYENCWDSHIKVIEEWAKTVENCVILYVNGRMGWKKVLEPSGYEFDSITLSKVLKDEDHDTRSPSVGQVH